MENKFYLNKDLDQQLQRQKRVNEVKKEKKRRENKAIFDSLKA